MMTRFLGVVAVMCVLCRAGGLVPAQAQGASDAGTVKARNSAFVTLEIARFQDTAWCITDIGAVRQSFMQWLNHQGDAPPVGDVETTLETCSQSLSALARLHLGDSVEAARAGLPPVLQRYVTVARMMANWYLMTEQATLAAGSIERVLVNGDDAAASEVALATTCGAYLDAAHSLYRVLIVWHIWRDATLSARLLHEEGTGQPGVC